MVGKSHSIADNKTFQEAMGAFEEISIAYDKVRDDKTLESHLTANAHQAQYEVVVAAIDAHTAVASVLRIKEWLPPCNKGGDQPS